VSGIHHGLRLLRAGVARVGHSTVLLALLLGWTLTSATPAAAVNVRWRQDVGAADRTGLERTYLLAQPDYREERTWAYVLLDVSSGNIRRLVSDPHVEDTHGVDRQGFSVSVTREVGTFRSRLLVKAWHSGVLGAAFLILGGLVLRRFLKHVVLRPDRPVLSRCGRVTVVLVGFGLCAAVGYLTTGRTLSSDDAFSVWVAQAVLRGDRISVDAFDAGAPLLWWLSLLGQWLTGGRVIGEIGLAVVLGAIGSVVTGALVWRVTRSVVLAGVFGGLACFAYCFSNPYSYHKVALYPVALATLWWYADRPALRRGIGLGLLVSVALLTRHDHGLYVGLAVLTAVAVAKGRESFATLAVVSVSALLPLMPWLVVVGSREGLVDYFTSRVHLASYLGIENARAMPDLTPAWPLVGSARPWPVQVGVQWTAGLSDGERQASERTLGLRPVRGSTEIYLLSDTTTTSFEALARTPHIVSTRGVDSLGSRPSSVRGRLIAARNTLAAWSLAPLPRALGEPTSPGLVYSVVVALPLLALLLVVPGVRRSLSLTGPMSGAGHVLPCVVLLAGAHYGLLRRPEQVSDTLPIDLVLLAWIVGQAWSPAAHGAVRFMPRVAATLLLAVTVLGAGDAVHAMDSLAGTGVLDGLPAARAQAVMLWDAHTATRPLDVFAPSGERSDRTIVRYLNACTRPTDRIWEPTGNFATAYYADRGVVEHMWWYAGFRAGRAQELRTLQWLATQRVPLVVIRSVGQFRDVFADYPLIGSYVREHYADVTSRLASEDVFREGRPLVVLARRDLAPSGRYEALDLPCYAG